MKENNKMDYSEFVGLIDELNCLSGGIKSFLKQYGKNPASFFIKPLISSLNHDA